MKMMTSRKDSATMTAMIAMSSGWLLSVGDRKRDNSKSFSSSFAQDHKRVSQHSR